MRQVNVHEAKSQLSRLLEEVERGDEITIARNGVPVAKLTKIESLRRSGFGASPEFREWTDDRLSAVDEQIAQALAAEVEHEEAELRGKSTPPAQ